MKILHFALFYSSKPVTNYLYARDIDPDTIHLNDYAFMERVVYITVSEFNLNLSYLIFLFNLDQHTWMQASHSNIAVLQIRLCRAENDDVC